MKYRAFGRTGMRVSQVGYGAWGIGNSEWQGADDSESLKALHKSIDLGLNFIDTALAYGDGHSETLVGKVIRERSENIYVASKIPPKNRKWPAPAGIPVEEVFPGDYMMNCAEKSLKNLGIEAIDIYQLHVWSDEWVEQGDWLETVQKLKEQGKIRFFGISINDHQPSNAIQLIQTGVVDSVQVIYNIFDQSPEDALLPTCEEHQVGVIVRVPFDEGSLTGKITPQTIFPKNDFRNKYFKGDRKQEVYDRVKSIANDMDISVDNMAEIALRYVLSHPAVSTVIPGMRSIRNVERNCAVGDGIGLTAHQVEELKNHRWVRDFYH